MERFRGLVKKRAVRRTINILVMLLLLWTVAGFLVLPPILRGVAVRQASKALGRKVEIAQVRVNPYALSITVRGLRVNEREGEEAFLRLNELYVRASAKSLFKLAPMIAEVRVVKPYLHIVHAEDGRFNFSDLVEHQPAKPPPPKTASKPLRFSVSNLQVTGGEIALEDKPQQKSHSLSDIELTVPSISNFPDFIDTGVQPYFSAALDGSPIHLDGTSKPFSESLETRVVLDVQNMDIPRYVGYAPMALPFQIPSGKLTARVELAYLLSENQVPLLTLWGDLSLSQFELNDAAGAKVLSLPDFRIEGFFVRPLLQRFYCQKVSIEKPELSVSRDRQGNVNLLSLLPSGGSRAAAPAQKSAEEAESPVLEVDQIELSRAKVAFTDRANRLPFTTILSPIDLDLRLFSTKQGKETAYKLGLTAESGGALSLDGTFSLQPLAAKLHCDLKQLNLAPLRAYVPDSVPLALHSGSLSVGGDAVFASPASGVRAMFKGDVALEKFAATDRNAGIQWDALRLSNIEAGYEAPKTTFKGEFALEKFLVIDERAGDQLAQWNALRLKSIAASYAPLKLSIGEISLDHPGATVIISTDGTPNIRTLFASGEAGNPAAAAPSQSEPASAPSPDVTVGRIILRDGQFSFADRSVTPAYSVALAAMEGKVEGVSLDPNKTAEVSFSARLDNTAPLVITGTLRPAKENLLVDLHIDFRNIELSPATPYADKYIGYPVTEGKLTLGLDYVIRGRKLDSENHIFLDQFTLGDRVENSTATHAPVKFALALLRDRHGVIELNIPVSGSLNDPKFRVLPVIVQVLLNIVEKAAISPFSLVASLIGGGEEMSYVEFDYGSAALDTAAKKKLDGVVKLLENRPALRLELHPQLDPERDTEALRKEFMERKLKIQKLRDTVKAGQVRAEIHDVKIEPQEYEKYLTLAYKAEDIPEKPRNLFGAKTVPGKEMEELLLRHTSVARDDLRLLAYRRAANIRDYLLASKAIDADRLFIVEPQEATPNAAGGGAKPRTQFTLDLGGQGAPPPLAKAFEPPPVTPQSSDTVEVKPRASWGRRLLIGAGVGGAILLVLVLVVH